MSGLPDPSKLCERSSSVPSKLGERTCPVWLDALVLAASALQPEQEAQAVEASEWLDLLPLPVFRLRLAHQRGRAASRTRLQWELPE